MDIFQQWENLWNPIATPTADLGAEAQRKYQAGEIDVLTYLAAKGENDRLLAGISDAKSDYAAYVAANPLNPWDAVIIPTLKIGENIVMLAVIVGTIYVLANWKKLVEA